VPALAWYWQGSEGDGRARRGMKDEKGMHSFEGSGRADLTMWWRGKLRTGNRQKGQGFREARERRAR
jgi:hypothetical protein